MPLFMDLHKASDYDVKPTVDEIKRNHIADLAVQHKYGVKFLQYWINEEAGMVFCLMEAPDKEACAAVHREAHGAMPCNVIELKGGDYTAIMGNEGKVNEYDIVETPAGSLDTAYRMIMVVDIISIKLYEELFTHIGQIVKKTNGRPVNTTGYRETIAFTSPVGAIECALELIDNFKSSNDSSNEIRIGISAASPLDEQGSFFEYGIQLANRLCEIAVDGQVVVSSLVKQLAGAISWNEIKNNSAIKLIEAEEEKFLNRLSETAHEMIAGPAFDTTVLGKKLGLSKSQLYRKILSLTGRAAVSYIQELRLQKAFKLIKSKQGNISEIAFESGFSSPSYFTRSFQKRFYVPPAQLLKHA
jgi:AraC-like DNA-binding protein